MSVNSEWVEDKSHLWVTPGGDPVWCCGVCGKGQHVYGIENLHERIDVCPDCGSLNRYPWEIRDEQITDAETDL